MRVPAKPCDSQYHGVTSFESAVVMISRQPGDHARPDDEPVVDRLLQRRVDVPRLVRADDRGVAGLERREDVGRRDVGLVGRRGLQPERRHDRHRDVVVRRVVVALGHPGHQGQAGAVDHPIIGHRDSTSRSRSRSTPDEPPVLDDDGRARLRRVLTVQDVGVRKDDSAHLSLLRQRNKRASRDNRLYQTPVQKPRRRDGDTADRRRRRRRPDGERDLAGRRAGGLPGDDRRGRRGRARARARADRPQPRAMVERGTIPPTRPAPRAPTRRQHRPRGGRRRRPTT